MSEPILNAIEVQQEGRLVDFEINIQPLEKQNNKFNKNDDSFETQKLEDQTDIGSKSLLKHVKEIEKIETTTKINSQNIINNKQSQEKDIQNHGEALTSEGNLSNKEYQHLLEMVMLGELHDFQNTNNNLSKRILFLAQVMEDSTIDSNNVLKTILPLYSAEEIRKTLKKIKFSLVNETKPLLVIKRLAPEGNPNIISAADQSLVILLLQIQEGSISQLDHNTLGFLRRNDTLGDKYYKEISKQGKPSRDNFKKLKILSAKISTICYAYYLEESYKIISTISRTNSVMKKNLLKQIKGLNSKERAILMKKLTEKKVVDPNQKINTKFKKSEPKSMKNQISGILKDALKMKTKFEEMHKENS